MEMMQGITVDVAAGSPWPRIVKRANETGIADTRFPTLREQAEMWQTWGRTIRIPDGCPDSVDEVPLWIVPHHDADKNTLETYLWIMQKLYPGLRVSPHCLSKHARVIGKKGTGIELQAIDLCAGRNASFSDPEHMGYDTADFGVLAALCVAPQFAALMGSTADRPLPPLLVPRIQFAGIAAPAGQMQHFLAFSMAWDRGARKKIERHVQVGANSRVEEVEIPTQGPEFETAINAGELYSPSLMIQTPNRVTYGGTNTAGCAVPRLYARYQLNDLRLKSKTASTPTKPPKVSGSHSGGTVAMAPPGTPAVRADPGQNTLPVQGGVAGARAMTDLVKGHQ